MIVAPSKDHGSPGNRDIVLEPDVYYTCQRCTACRIHPVKPEQCSGFPNTWNFPGWRQVCEAIPVPVESGLAH